MRVAILRMQQRESNNPEPLQEMVPAMRFTPIQPHITNQQQLANGLTEESFSVRFLNGVEYTICETTQPIPTEATSPVLSDNNTNKGQ